MTENIRVLLVDDEPVNIDILETYIREHGYEAVSAENGAKALEILEQEKDKEKKFDLILLDRMMPVMDGLSFLKKIKSDIHYRDIPVIMQTAANTKQDVLAGINAGAFYYLTKPYDEEILMAIVQSALHEHRTRGHLQATYLNEDLREQLSTISFRFQSLEDIEKAVKFLIQFCPNPDRSAFGLTEMMINAMEHGNLEISYDDKSRLNLAGQWREEIDRRLALPEYAHRYATITLEKRADSLRFVIQDSGKGFNWKPYLEVSAERAFDNHGRGVALACMRSFESVEYHGAGNEVHCVISLTNQSQYQH